MALYTMKLKNKSNMEDNIMSAEERFETGEYTINATGTGVKTVSGTTAVPMDNIQR